jgi:hypothetical protein
MKHIIATVLLATALASPARGGVEADWLKVVCDNNEYSLYRHAMEVNACEMFRGVTTCNRGKITHWGDRHIAWVTGDQRYPIISAYSLDFTTPMYANNPQRRIWRIVQDLTHLPIDLQNNTGGLREAQSMGMACLIVEQVFPEVQFLQGGMIIHRN